MNNFGISLPQITQIREYFKAVLKPQQKVKVWIFGSRSTGKARPYSDVDLLVSAQPPIGYEQLTKIAQQLEESDIPFKFDLVSLESLYPPKKNKAKTHARSPGQLQEHSVQ